LLSENKYGAAQADTGNGGKIVLNENKKHSKRTLHTRGKKERRGGTKRSGKKRKSIWKIDTRLYEERKLREWRWKFEAEKLSSPSKKTQGLPSNTGGKESLGSSTSSEREG